MKRFHLIFGLLAVIAFLLTGQYMDKYYQHLTGMPDGPRMLYRTRHIFILLSGLLHLVSGAYFNWALSIQRRLAQVLGSILLVTATILFLVAFFYEPRLPGLYTPLSHWGTYAIVAGTFLHLIGVAGGVEGSDRQLTKD